MEQFIEWVNTHGLAMIGALFGLFTVIAKITPTPKDDAWVAKLLGWLNLLPETAREKISPPKS
jgi:hypothetical protein